MYILYIVYIICIMYIYIDIVCILMLCTYTLQNALNITEHAP